MVDKIDLVVIVVLAAWWLSHVIKTQSMNTHKVRLSVPIHSWEKEDDLPIEDDWVFKDVTLKIPPIIGMEYEDPGVMASLSIARIIEQEFGVLAICKPVYTDLSDFSEHKQFYLDNGWSENL